MRRLILLAALVAANYAFASGDYGPAFTRFKAYSRPDIEPELFQAGRLGVLQPGMQRVYLYNAWRAITLGPKLKAEPGSFGGLARANGSEFGTGWTGSDTSMPDAGAWLRETGLSASQFGACPHSSNILAMATLKQVKARKDASPARVKAWVEAQEQVSDSCSKAEDVRYQDPSVLLKFAPPAALPDAEPAYWRQLRDYQRAAFMFYTERYVESAALFDRVGATAGHPMRELGSYLGLRAQARLAARQGVKASEAQRTSAYAMLVARRDAILTDESLEENHEAASAALRAARLQLLPQAAHAELSKYLSNPMHDPFADDSLGDWAIVSGVVEAKPGQHDFIDWIDNLRACGYPKGADKSCRVQAEFAAAQWQRTKTRTWLVASLMLAQQFGPGMEVAAMAVKEGDPEYVTVRYHLARLLRLAGRLNEARAVSDGALRLDLAHGSRNLLREERFAVATSLAEAATFMKRIDIDFTDDASKPVERFNEDVITWLRHGLASADMVSLARQDVLGANVRAHLAAAVFVRAELLAKPAVALAALDVLDPLAPAMKNASRAYRRAKTPAERRHQMLLAALRFGLSPQMAEDSEPITAGEDDQIAASNWCSFKRGDATGSMPFPWQLPAMPSLGDKAAARAELARLEPLKTATGFVGEHVLARARSHPRDPDLPWLLHMVVASTRGGCLDADAKKLSRDAFSMLHQRFPGHAWTRATPYHY